MPPLDPFKWNKSVDVNIENSNSPFKLNIHSINNIFVGLSKLRATKIV